MNKYEKALLDLKHGTGGAEALEVAMEALEKQIPKKVIDVISTDNVYIKTVCPTCEHIFGVVRKDNYCWYCGQTLDWSEVE